MGKDISSVISGWNYEPGSINARWVEGDDGRVKIQLRLDLGLFQMEVEGRPDGKMPRGYPSLLDYYRSLEKTSPSAPPPIRLDEANCLELQQEAMQYYYRYLSSFALRHLDGVIGDTQHNLDMIDLVTQYAENEDLAWHFLQFYPYVLMMNSRARAEKSMAGRRYEEAVRILQKALDDIKAFWSEHGESDMGLGNQEIEMLNNMLRQLENKKPRSRVDQMREDLEKAIAAEDYEKAAALRDALKHIDRMLSRSDRNTAGTP